MTSKPVNFIKLTKSSLSYSNTWPDELYLVSFGKLTGFQGSYFVLGLRQGC